MTLPVEICDLIVAFADMEPSWITPPAWDQRLPQIEYRKTTPTPVQSLRLVNRAFCEAATPVLFRKIHVTSQCTLRNLLALSERNYADFVQEVVVGANVGPYEIPDSHMAMFLDELSPTLPMSIRRFPNLRSLSAVAPVTPTKGLPEVARLLFVKAIRDALQYGNFDKLEVLNMALPLMHDFAMLAECPPSTKKIKNQLSLRQVLSRVRHLRLRVQDPTGEGGARFGKVRQSAAQAEFPNRKHVSGFHDFIKCAGKLESLSIACTHALDMSWHQIPNPDSLHALELFRTEISLDDFVSCFLPNAKSLQAIDLRMVELFPGRWETFLLSMCNLPRLRYISVTLCAYYGLGRDEDSISRTIEDDERPSPFYKDVGKKSRRESSPQTLPAEDPDEFFEGSDYESEIDHPSVHITPSIDTPISRDLEALQHLEKHVEEVRRNAGLSISPILHEPLFPHRPPRIKPPSKRRQIQMIELLTKWDRQRSLTIHEGHPLAKPIRIIGTERTKQWAANADIIGDVPSFRRYAVGWEEVVKRARYDETDGSTPEEAKGRLQQELIQLFLTSKPLDAIGEELGD